MKNFLIVLLLAMIPVYFLTISGCESTTGLADGNGVIKGTIRDSASSLPLDSVVITTTPATSTVMTNSSGNYIISGVSDGSYIVTAKKPGYFTAIKTAEVIDADTATASTLMRFTGVYTFNNLKIAEYINNSSLSGVNLRDGIVINEVQLNDPNKDIQMRDSAGTSSNFYLRSGDLALQFAGSKTSFGVPLNNPKTGQPTFTKTEFDTLSKIYNFDGVSFYSYFNLDRTSYINTPGMANNVYPFWLEGRATSNLQLFGVIYLRESYIGSDNLFYLVIDVKINRLGFNLFNGNQ
jgi:hypothetical protein